MPKVASYKQKFRKQWLKNPALQNWIAAGADETNALCKYCNCSLAAKLCDLVAHSQSAKHKANAGVTKTNLKIPFRSVKLETQQQEAALAMFVAVHGSIASVDHLSSMCKQLFKDAEDIRNNRTKCTYIIKNVLAPHFSEELLKDIYGNKFSLLIDESTDISVTKMLGIAIQYFSIEQNKICSTFLNLTELECGDAVSICSALKQVLKTFKLDIKNIIGIGTDNANVMVGGKNSVSTILKQENPNIVAVRCICHSVQLAVSHACKAHLPTNLEFLVSETYNWFSHSSIRQTCYKKMYNAINDGEDPLKITRVSDTRWLSIEVAVGRIIDQWLELQTHFGIAMNVEKCHKAKLLYDIYNDKISFALLLFLRPILTEMQKLNKNFQSNDSDPTKLLKTFKMAFAILKEKISSPNDNVDIFKDDYKSFIERDCYLGYNFEKYIKKLKLDNILTEIAELEIRTNCTDFVITLIDELKKRLPDNIEILEHLDLFAAENALKPVKKDVTPILEYFKVPTTDIEKILLQFNNIRLIDWQEKTNTAALWGEIRKYKDAGGNLVFSELSEFVIKILTLPWSNAEVERIFSQMNLVKTKIRNRMQLPTLNSILTVRYGLKRLNKCCNNYIVPNAVIRLIGTKEIYTDDSVEIEDIILSDTTF